MSICPICGCKTDELDFKACVIEGKNVNLCSFCENQIKKFNSGEEPTASQLNWLDAVLKKEIPLRDDETFKALHSLNNKFSKTQNQQTFTTDSQKIPEFSQKSNLNNFKEDFSNFKQSENISPDAQKQIDILTKRLEHLEKSFAKYKKAQIMKTIIELTAPVILLIIGLIIFFASGLYDSLSMLTDLTNML